MRKNFFQEMGVKCPSRQAGHRERYAPLTVSLERLEFTDRDGGEAGIDLKGEGLGSPSLAMGQAGKLFAVAEQEFNLKTGFVVAVERDGIDRAIGAEQ